MNIVNRWMPLWLLALVLPLLVIASVVLYRRDRRLVSPARGRSLLLLRTLLIAVLVTLLLDPALVERTAVVERDELIVVVDTSQSMSLPHDPSSGDGRSRLGAAIDVWNSGAISGLAERFRLTLVGLDDVLRPLAGVHELAISGDGTDFAGPLIELALARARGGTAAIVLASDGRHNAARDPRASARELARIGVPLVTIAVGPADPQPDLAIVAVDSNARVFAGDEIEIEATVAAHGLAVDRLPLWIDEGERRLAEFVIEDLPAEGSSRWPLRLRIDEPGRHTLSVSIPAPAVDSEANAANNRLAFALDVLSGDAKVLLLDGGPRWEFRYLRDTWGRDERVAIDAFLVTAPPDVRLPEGFPRSGDALAAYDVVVLGDVDASLFSRDEQLALADLVRVRGATLVVVCGERSMPYSWVSSVLPELLPVELLDAAPPRGAGVRRGTSAERLTLAADGELSPLVRLTPGRQQNVELWEHLPGPFWTLPVRGARPGASVLVRARDADLPVFVTRPFGAGTVLFSGIDSTWRWRFRFGDVLYRRFWGQVVREALATRLRATDTNVALGTDRSLYTVDSIVRVAARLASDTGDPVESGRVDAVITTDVPQRVTRRVAMRSVPASGGRYEGTLSDDDLAALVDMARAQIRTTDSRELSELEFAVTIDAQALPGYAARPDRARATFSVALPDRRETAERASDHQRLDDLATISGGFSVPLERVEEIAARLRATTRVRDVTTTHALIEHPWALAVGALALLVLEWVLRKRWNLV